MRDPFSLGLIAQIYKRQSGAGSTFANDAVEIDGSIR